MGVDKAGLVFEGRPLWQRQLATLRATGPRELFISGQPGRPYDGAGLPILADAEAGRGPLAGLEAALWHAANAHLLVLAIDLPAMTPSFLQGLARRAEATGHGVVPRAGAAFEPLAAVYFRACLPLATACLRGSDHSMQNFVRRALADGLVIEHPLTPADLPLFHNLNTPADLRGGSKSASS